MDIGTINFSVKIKNIILVIIYIILLFYLIIIYHRCQIPHLWYNSKFIKKEKYKYFVKLEIRNTIVFAIPILFYLVFFKKDFFNYRS